MSRDGNFRRWLYILPLVLAGGVCVMECVDWYLSTSRQPLASPGTARLLTDQTGHVSRLPQEVRSVGTPGISMASLILALGGGQKLSAITPEVGNNPWLRRIVPEVASLPTPFSRPAGVNMEVLLAARPDVVTLWRGNDLLGKQLESVGVPVLYVGYATPEELKAAARLLGQALGAAESARAEEFVRYYEDNLQRVAVPLANLPDSARPRVYYASIAPLVTEGTKSMVNAWIEAAGGRNVAAQNGLVGDGKVQMEEVLAWNPEIIVTLNAAQRKSILEDPHWKNVSAVQTGRVLVNPGGVNAWCTRAAEASLQVLWAAKVFHPERFATLDMNLETRRFYRQFYGYELSDDDLARVLNGLEPGAPQIFNPPRRTP